MKTFEQYNNELNIIDDTINNIIKPNELMIWFDFIYSNEDIFLDAEYKEEDSFIIYSKKRHHTLWIKKIT